jgi:hypothetical protein
MVVTLTGPGVGANRWVYFANSLPRKGALRDPRMEQFQSHFFMAPPLRATAHLLGSNFGHRGYGSDAGVTFTSCRDRMIVTLLGWATSYARHGHPLFYGLSVALCVLWCSASAKAAG